jgi:hypothetical protein
MQKQYDDEVIHDFHNDGTYKGINQGGDLVDYDFNEGI